MRKIITGLSDTRIVIAGLGTAACAAEEPARTDDKRPPKRPPQAGLQPARRPAGETPAAAEARSLPRGGEAAAAGGECCKAGDTTPPLDLDQGHVPKADCTIPITTRSTRPHEAGHKKYLSFSCNGCHGGGGGGGMCPPLTNDTWVYGPDDDTLFRLIALGSRRAEEAGL